MFLYFGYFPFLFRGKDFGSDCTSPWSLLTFSSSPEPKVHRGAYSILMLRRLSVARRRRRTSVHIFRDLSFETARPIKVKFYVEPPWVEVTKFVRGICDT